MKEIISGCKAEPYHDRACKKRGTCRRYAHYRESLFPFQDRFSAHRTCHTDDYPHFILDDRPIMEQLANIIETQDRNTVLMIHNQEALTKRTGNHNG